MKLSKKHKNGSFFPFFFWLDTDLPKIIEKPTTVTQRRPTAVEKAEHKMAAKKAAIAAAKQKKGRHKDVKNQEKKRKNQEKQKKREKKETNSKGKNANKTEEEKGK